MSGWIFEQVKREGRQSAGITQRQVHNREPGNGRAKEDMAAGVIEPTAMRAYDFSPMDGTEIKTAIYLAGHGSKTKPRLIELQYHRVMRYRQALVRRHGLSRGLSRAAPAVFLDLRLPSFGMGTVELNEVPGFKMLLEDVQNHRYGVVFIDLDEVRPGLTPDYESGFVRHMLEAAGATILNAYTDDKGAFAKELKSRCGQNARDYEVTDSSDVVNFFPSLASDILVAALRKELEIPMDRHGEALELIHDRLEGLRRLRPYAGGGTPFVEDRLSAGWRRLRIKTTTKPVE